MKKITTLLLSGLLAIPAWANVSLEPLLNKVSLQLHAEAWVTTKTALVDVLINAAVNDQDIEKVQSGIMQKLNQLITNVEWHIVSLNRQQDQSGLESVQITAEARVAQSDLNNLRNKAKTISKAGETYKIDNIQFVPSEDETRQANINLRNNIYDQVKSEIDILNQHYPNQKYYLHQIDFNSFQASIAAAPKAIMNAVSIAQTTTSSSLSIGNKQELNASIILASMPDQIPQILNKAAS